MLLIDYQLYLIIQSYRWQFCEVNCWSLEALCADAAASAVTTWVPKVEKNSNLTTSVSYILTYPDRREYKNSDTKVVNWIHRDKRENIKMNALKQTVFPVINATLSPYSLKETVELCYFFSSIKFFPFYTFEGYFCHCREENPCFPTCRILDLDSVKPCCHCLEPQCAIWSNM